MLLSRQIKSVSNNTQAQERLLVKVVQQNEETTKLLQRVEKVVIGITDGLKEGFSGLSKHLSETKEEDLIEIKELWMKKMSELEKIIEIGGENSSQQIEKQMKKLDAMLSAKLLDLDINSDHIKLELQNIRQELVETNESRLRGEIASDTKLNTILSDLKSLQTQLDRVEQNTIQLFNSLEIGFDGIRRELSTNSEGLQGLNELQDIWMKKVKDLEISLSQNPTIDVLNNQMKKMEAMLNAKLVDLDIQTSNLSPQLQEMKKLMGDLLVEHRVGESESEKKMKEVMNELKGLQTQLVEVIHLQTETLNNLNEVCCFYIFIFILIYFYNKFNLI